MSLSSKVFLSTCYPTWGQLQSCQRQMAGKVAQHETEEQQRWGVECAHSCTGVFTQSSGSAVTQWSAQRLLVPSLGTYGAALSSDRLWLFWTQHVQVPSNSSARPSNLKLLWQQSARRSTNMSHLFQKYCRTKESFQMRALAWASSLTMRELRLLESQRWLEGRPLRTWALWELVTFSNPTVFVQNLSAYRNSPLRRGSFEDFHLLNTNIKTWILLHTVQNTKLTSYMTLNFMPLKIFQNSFYILIQSKHIYENTNHSSI